MTEKDFKIIAINVMLLFIYTLAMYNVIMMVAAIIVTACMSIVCIVDMVSSESLIKTGDYDSSITRYIAILINILMICVLLYHKSDILASIIIFIMVYSNIKVRFDKPKNEE